MEGGLLPVICMKAMLASANGMPRVRTNAPEAGPVTWRMRYGVDSDWSDRLREVVGS